MRKLISIILIIVIIGTIIFSYPINSFALTTEDGFIYADRKNGSIITVAITGYSGSNKNNLVIPDTINGKVVTSIEERAFRNRDITGNIKLPEGLITIGNEAFLGCTKLESVNISESVTTIGVKAFSGCTMLKSVNIPKNVTTIGREVFSFCGLTGSIELPEGLITIEEEAFYHCEKLESINIPKSVTTIKDEAFLYCGFTNLIIPATITNLGNNVFGSCGKLTEVTIEKGITHIPTGTFWGCNYLTNIKIPEGLISIGEGAFNSCYRLENVDIPKSVTTIENKAFSNCGFKTLIIPRTITNLGAEAFSDCSDLTDVTIENGITSIKYRTFCSCDNLANIQLPEGLVDIEDCVFQWCRSLSNITIPEGVVSIGESAFQYTGLKEITLPESLKNIGAYIFEDSKFTQIPYLGQVKEIPNRAFYGCSELTSAEIPKGINLIGDQAFSNCPKLGHINIPEGLKNIGEEAFKGLSNRAKIDLPMDIGTIEQIGTGAFDYNSTLYVYHSVYNEAVQKIGNEYSYCKTYKVTFKDYDNTIIEEQFIPEWSNVTNPPIPNRKDCKFLGWDKEFSDITCDIETKAMYTKLSGAWAGATQKPTSTIRKDGKTYYEIENPEQLAYIAQNPSINKNYILTKDIILNDIPIEYDLETGELITDASLLEEWTPISMIGLGYGNENIFDGNGHTISGVYINNIEKENCGLFDKMDGGKIKDLKIENSYIRAREYVGGVIGASNKYDYENIFYLQNVSYEGAVVGEEYLGGITGYSYNADIRDCTNYGNIYANLETKEQDTGITNSRVGGIAGTALGRITNVINEGNILGKGIEVGGIAGYAEGTIESATNKGKVQGESSFVGGIVGQAFSLQLRNSHNLGEVKGYHYVGGILGQQQEESIISNSYNMGNIQGTGGLIGGLLGSNKGKVLNSYNTGNVKGLLLIGGIAGENIEEKDKQEGDKSYIRIEKCYNVGKVEGQDIVGGIVGIKNANIGRYKGVYNCYYLKDDTINVNTNIDGVGANIEIDGQVLDEQGFHEARLKEFFPIYLDDSADGTYENLGYPRCAITLNRNGVESDKEEKIVYTNPDPGNLFPIPTITAELYILDKWVDENGNEITYDTVFTKDTTIYATWIPKHINKVEQQGQGAIYGNSTTVYYLLTSNFNGIYNIEINNLPKGVTLAEKQINLRGNGIFQGMMTLEISDTVNAGTYNNLELRINNTVISDKFSLIIEKAESTYVKEPNAKILTENETEQELVEPGNTNDGTIQYSIDGTNFTNTIPKAKQKGTYKVYHKIIGDNNHLNSEVSTIEVIIKERPIIEIDEVILNKTELSLEKGKTESLIATISPSNTTQSKTITWASSNTNVATVDENGKVTAISEGTVVITATASNGKTETCEVEVTNPKEDEPDKPTTVKLGDVNKDGKIDVFDARVILRKAASRQEFTEYEKQAGDVNKDGKVNVLDARRILMYSAKIITKF